MKDELWWLKEAIVDYLRVHKKQDAPSVVSHMKLRCDVTLTAINELITEKKVDRRWNGCYYEVHLTKQYKGNKKK